jgi:hypothetical protein
MKLESTAIVIVGEWNPAIITPPWLADKGIVSRKAMPEKMPITVSPIRIGWQFELAGCQWGVTQTQVSITSPRGKNCGTYAAKLLELLPHTPVRAIGSNFVYHSSLSEWPGDRRPRLGPLGLDGLGAHGVQQTMWQGKKAVGSGTVLGIALTQDSEAVTVSFNVHRDCDSAKKAARYARRWYLDKALVRQTMRSLFGVSDI